MAAVLADVFGDRHPSGEYSEDEGTLTEISEGSDEDEFFPSRDDDAMGGYATFDDDEDEDTYDYYQHRRYEDEEEDEFGDPQGDEGYSTADEATDNDLLEQTIRQIRAPLVPSGDQSGDLLNQQPPENREATRLDPGAFLDLVDRVVGPDRGGNIQRPEDSQPFVTVAVTEAALKALDQWSMDILGTPCLKPEELLASVKLDDLVNSLAVQYANKGKVVPDGLADALAPICKAVHEAVTQGRAFHFEYPGGSFTRPSYQGLGPSAPAPAGPTPASGPPAPTTGSVPEAEPKDVPKPSQPKPAGMGGLGLQSSHRRKQQPQQPRREPSLQGLPHTAGKPAAGGSSTAEQPSTSSAPSVPQATPSVQGLLAAGGKPSAGPSAGPSEPAPKGGLGLLPRRAVKKAGTAMSAPRPGSELGTSEGAGAEAGGNSGTGPVLPSGRGQGAAGGGAGAAGGGAPGGGAGGGTDGGGWDSSNPLFDPNDTPENNSARRQLYDLRVTLLRAAMKMQENWGFSANTAGPSQVRSPSLAPPCAAGHSPCTLGPAQVKHAFGKCRNGGRALHSHPKDLNVFHLYRYAEQYRSLVHHVLHMRGAPCPHCFPGSLSPILVFQAAFHLYRPIVLYKSPVLRRLLRSALCLRGFLSPAEDMEAALRLDSSLT
eukprot:jgi/Botrbrau1/4118/Bobra.152_3s0064.1